MDWLYTWSIITIYGTKKQTTVNRRTNDLITASYCYYAHCRLKHRLTFESEEKLVLAKDANIQNEDTFDIYDPRNPLNKRRRGEEGAKIERQRQRGKPRI